MCNSKKCIQCKQIFYNPKNGKKKWDETKFCSRDCYWKSLKGKLPISGCSFGNGHKRNLGIKQSTKHRLKNSINRRGSKNWNWKGDKSLPCATHIWVRNKKGKASEYKCIDCGG